jgi:HEAT repeat protein/GTPase SAR1 family protein
MMTEQAVESPTKLSTIEWQQICQLMLEQTLPINPLTTHPEESELEGEDISLSLLAKDNTSCLREKFLDCVRQTEKNIAIIGASGTGKTTFLRQIALNLLEKSQEVPIWISKSALGQLSLSQYLEEKWLTRVSQLRNLPETNWSQAFTNLLHSGRVWLLLDGFEQLDSAFATVVTASPPDWQEKVKIILTSRHRQSPASLSLEQHFEIYRPLPLTYPTEVKRFIKQWFAANSTGYVSPSSHQSERQDLAEQLYQNIELFGSERLRECWETPLRLALLCRLWQTRHPYFPTSRATLYRHLVQQFYQWQAENVVTTGEQQQQIETALSQLARRVLESSDKPDLLTHQQVIAVFGEDTSLFNLVLRLGWLQSDPNLKEYTFFDRTFQDYFAALAIQDWHFFLPEIPDTIPASNYPIFAEKWQRVILFWLGCEEKSEADKNAFLDALTQFQDRCGTANLYGKRAYYLAVASLAEFPYGERASNLIQQALEWSFQSKNPSLPLVEAARNALLKSDRSLVIEALITLWRQQPDRSKDILRYLEKIGRGHPKAIAALIYLLKTADNNPLKWQLAESLGRIEPQNTLSSQILLQLLETATDDEQRQLALSCLERLAKGSSKVITTLVRLLPAGSPTLTRRTFECLETIGQGNATAIAALVQLIRTTKSAHIHRQAAESLEKIDPGNPTAIAVLVQLLQTANNEDIRQQAVYSLGEISPGNQEAISALVNLLATTVSVYTHWLAVSSLGKIALGSSEASTALVKLIQTTEQPLLRKDSIDNLLKIAPAHPVGLQALIGLTETSKDESLCWEAATTLGKIDPGNPTAIAVLSQLLDNTEDEFMRRQAAASLGEIDAGNLKAILALVDLLQSSRSQDIRGLAVESLGAISTAHPAALASLIRCLEQEKEANILKLAAKSLGQIGQDHPLAIASLLQLLRSNSDEAARLQAVESLIQIVPESQISHLVSNLADLDDPISQVLLWQCSYHLSYRDFYDAWRNSGKEMVSFPAAATNFSDYLQQLSSELPAQTRLIVIDSSQILDPQHPLVDVYDQMLAQNCPPWPHGLPETISKLRLYWNDLRRNQHYNRFIAIFYENLDQNHRFSDDLITALSKFAGEICLVTPRSLDFPTLFSPQDTQALKQWLEQAMTGS